MAIQEYDVVALTEDVTSTHPETTESSYAASWSSWDCLDRL